MIRDRENMPLATPIVGAQPLRRADGAVLAFRRRAERVDTGLQTPVDGE